MIGMREIEEARGRIGDYVVNTPCTHSEWFTRRTGARIYFKLENLQMTGSFKERGALNRILTLGDAERARGVIAASAGNHAQGVAFHAGRLGIAATIVMPDRTPLIKVQNTRAFGARVVLAGGNFDEAYQEALRIREREGLTFVHPFDDDMVIAGQGTIGLEMLEQVPEMEVAIVPVGGGGLVSGVAVALKSVNPRIHVVGVQTATLPSMKASLDAGEPVTVPPGRTIADGIAVKRPGERTLAYVRKYVDEIVTVTDDEIANAILLLLEREKSVAEGAGAAALAALLHGKVPAAFGKRTVILVSGGNIDVNMIARVITRGLVKDGRMVRLVVQIEDRPGSLAHLLQRVAEHGCNVLEVYHDRAFSNSGFGETEVELTLETRGREHVEELRAGLERAGYRTIEL